MSTKRIERVLATRLKALARRHPVVALTGPRQSGKTTLARMTFPDRHYVSLEQPDRREYARADPRGFLGELRDGAILDEVQRVPELLSYLQVEVDERPEPGRFILTGSQNLQLLQSVSQSLAGRAVTLHLLPCSLDEVRRFPAPPETLFATLWTGGYPSIHDRALPPDEWLGGYVATYVERDVRQVLNIGDLLAFQTFLRVCAGRSAQLLNLSALAADCGISHNTAKAWVSVLETSFVVFRLPPLHANHTSRLVKTPKLHFHDTGLLCYLLGIRSADQIEQHPLRGAIFETWVASEIYKARVHHGLSPDLSFYRDRKGHEVDILVERGDALVAAEAKSGRTVASDFFDEMTWFVDHRETAGRAGAGEIVKVLIYGGDTRERRSAGLVLPWSMVPAGPWRSGSG